MMDLSTPLGKPIRTRDSRLLILSLLENSQQKTLLNQLTQKVIISDPGTKAKE